MSHEAHQHVWPGVGARLLCAACGDVIGVYERFHRDDERLGEHVATLVSMDPEARAQLAGASLYHLACAPST